MNARAMPSTNRNKYQPLEINANEKQTPSDRIETPNIARIMSVSLLLPAITHTTCQQRRNDEIVKEKDHFSSLICGA